MMTERECKNCLHVLASPDLRPCRDCYNDGDRTMWEPVLTETRDPINPPHYKLPGGFEVIQITRHLNLNLGSAVGYILRSGKKTLVENQGVEDLKKAIWHLQDEIQRITGDGDHAKP